MVIALFLNDIVKMSHTVMAGRMIRKGSKDSTLWSYLDIGRLRRKDDALSTHPFALSHISS